jgi:hypothetical protein
MKSVGAGRFCVPSERAAVTEAIPLAIGDLVYANDPRTPGLFRIINRGPKNWTITPVNADGTVRPGKGARFPDWMLTPAKAPAANGASPVGVPFVPHREDMSPGAVVRFAQDRAIYVVIANKIEKISIALIGGNEGRYWRATPSALTVIPLGNLADELTTDLAKLTKPEGGQ